MQTIFWVTFGAKNICTAVLRSFYLQWNDLSLTLCFLNTSDNLICEINYKKINQWADFEKIAILCLTFRFISCSLSPSFADVCRLYCQHTYFRIFPVEGGFVSNSITYFYGWIWCTCWCLKQFQIPFKNSRNFLFCFSAEWKTKFAMEITQPS